jgi:ABC-type oligopeptide transport system substrate-binding subunit
MHRVSTTSAAAAIPDRAGPTGGNRATLALDAMPLTDDPRWPADYNARQLAAALLLPLFDEPATIGGPAQPAAATATAAFDDFRRWRLAIDNDRRWSDDVALHADHVATAVREVMARAGTAAGGYLACRGQAGRLQPQVTVLDAGTLEITLDRPIGYLPHLLTMPQFAPVRSQPEVSLGAFRLLSRTDTAIELRRRTDARLELPDRLRFVHLATWNEAVRRYQVGEVDVTPLTSCGVGELELLQGRPDLFTQPIEVFGSLEFGNRTAALSPELRRALASTIDSDRLTAPLAGLVTGWPPHPPAAASARELADLRRALRDGVDIAYADFAPNDVVVEGVAAQLAETLGVPVTTRALSFPSYVRTVIRRDHELLYTLTCSDFAHPAARWSPWHSAASAARHAQLADPVLDRLIAAAEAVTGPAETTAWAAVERRWTELMPRIPLVQVQANYLRAPRLTAPRLTPAGLLRIQELRINGGPPARPERATAGFSHLHPVPTVDL